MRYVIKIETDNNVSMFRFDDEGDADHILLRMTNPFHMVGITRKEISLYEVAEDGSKERVRRVRID